MSQRIQLPSTNEATFIKSTVGQATGLHEINPAMSKDNARETPQLRSMQRQSPSINDGPLRVHEAGARRKKPESAREKFATV